MKLVLTFTMMAVMLQLGACSNGVNTDNGSGLPTGTWVALEPVQCLGNPWEQDWLSQDGHDPESYPKNPTLKGLEPAEFDIVRNFYLVHGVEVLDSAWAPKFEVVCMACSCPEGHTMFLLVRARDVEAMHALGYRTEAPRHD